MKNNLTWTLIIVLVIIVAVAGYLIFKNPTMNSPTGGVSNSGNTGGSDSGSNSDGNGDTQTTPKTYNAVIQNFAFSPSTITINKGDIVIWTNMDSVKHTVTSDSGSELDSNLFSQGQTFSHTFNTARTFNYHCTPHPNMKGNVIVQ